MRRQAPRVADELDLRAELAAHVRRRARGAAVVGVSGTRRQALVLQLSKAQQVVDPFIESLDAAKQHGAVGEDALSVGLLMDG